MTMRTWIRNLFASRPTRTIRKAPARWRPALEVLEDRLTPTPTITSFVVPHGTVQEGIISLSATATDPDGPVRFVWSVDPGSGQRTFYSGASVSVQVDGNNTYEVSVRASSNTVVAWADRDAHFTVTNVAPTIAISGASNANEGATYTLTLGAVTDPGPDTVEQYIVNWGDGSSSTYTTGGDKTHTYADDNAARPITIDLVDEDGTHTNRANPLNVAVINVAPTIAISGAASANEGATYSLTLGAVTDPGSDTVRQYLVYWGDSTSSLYSTGGVKTHTYVNGKIKPSITVDLIDEDGMHTNRANPRSLTVNNVAPTIHAFHVPPTVIAGYPVTLSTGVTDPANDPLTYTWTFTRPDATTFTLTGASPTFTPADNGNYGVSLTVSDDEQGSDTQTLTLTVYSQLAGAKFVQALFQYELGRSAAATEVVNWVSVLSSTGRLSAVVDGIGSSVEARNRLVAGWFQTYLGRTPSIDSISGIVTVLGSQTEEQVLSEILGSAEFFNRAQTLGFGGTAQENYVQALYQSLLGRIASAPEVDAQVAALQQVGQQSLALSFLQSQEYRTLVVRGYYTGLLSRSGSPEAVANFASSSLDVRAIRQSFESSQEFFEAAAGPSITDPATFTVLNTLDDGSVGSLRWAVGQANSHAGADTIDFDTKVFETPQTITLLAGSGGQVTLTDTATTTIVGPGTGLVSISGNNTSRVFAIDVGASAALSGLTFTGGNGVANPSGTAGDDGLGGAILNRGTLAVSASVVSASSAQTKGGGIYSGVNSTMALIDTVVRGNKSLNGYGGGVAVVDGTATITGGSIDANSAFFSGGAIDNYDPSTGSLTVTACTIEGNTALNGYGGAISNAGTMTVIDCTLSGNSATQGGGILNFSTLTVSDTTIESNSAQFNGGGLYNQGTTTLIDVTVNGNTATGGSGGGLYNAGTLTITDSTLDSNSAGFSGGALRNDAGTVTISGSTITRNASANTVSNNNGQMRITNSTIADNQATDDTHTTASTASLVNYTYLDLGDASVTLLNVTFSGNTSASPADAKDLYVNQSGTGIASVSVGNTILGSKGTGNPNVANVGGSITSLGHNLSFDASANLTAAGDLQNTDPLLAPLGNYGGPTQTLALLPGSPALEAGDNALIPTGVTTDQRGVSRIGNGAIDVGAVENQGYVLTVTGGTPQTALGGTAFTNPLTVTLTENGLDAPLSGATITFSGPANGAGIASTLTANTDTNGMTSVTATANGVPGAYTVTASASGATPASFSLTNELQPVFAGLTSPTITYGTSSFAFTGVLAAGATPATGSVTVTISGNGITPLSRFAPIGADGAFSATITTASLPANPPATYVVTYAYAGQDDFRTASDSSTTLTVNKANATVVVTPYSVTYDGSSHTATVTSITGVNGETGATVGTVTLSTTHTDAGTYSDSFSFTGSANYNDATGTITDVIDKASSAVVVTIDGGPFTYTGLAQTPASVMVTGAGGLSLTPTASYANNVNAGTATASYTYAGDANHTGSSDSENFTIGKANATVVTPYSVTYDGSPHVATVTSITGVNGETGATVGSVTLSDTAHVNAGTYSDSWSFMGTANYNDVASAPFTYTIDKAPSAVVVTISGGPFTYTGLAQTPATTVSVTGAGGLSLTPTAGYANNVNAGMATASYAFAGDANHEGSAASQDFTIARADAMVTVTGYSGTADGTSHGATGSIVGVAGDLLAAGSTLNLGARFTDAPGGTAFWNFDGGTNYNDQSGSVAINLAAVITPVPGGTGTPGNPVASGDYLDPATGDRGAAFAGLSAQQRFIQALYLDALGRAGSVAELDGWLPALNGPNGQAAVAQGIEFSQEGRGNLVRGWYQTYLGRAAVGGEEMGHVNALLAGMTEEAVLGGILGSAEFFAHAQTLVSSGTPQERFVQALYQLLLDRTPDASEVAGHVAELSGGQSQAQVALGFLQGPEFRTNLVALYYSALLHRTASATEINGHAASGLGADMIRLSFESSPEFFANG